VELAELEELMRFAPTIHDTAHWFKCSTSCIDRVISKHFSLTFREFRDERMVRTRHSLKQKAVSEAMDGNTAMLKFCLTNLCGWSDKSTDTLNHVEIKISHEDDEL